MFRILITNQLKTGIRKPNAKDCDEKNMLQSDVAVPVLTPTMHIQYFYSVIVTTQNV